MQGVSKQIERQTLGMSSLCKTMKKVSINIGLKLLSVTNRRMLFYPKLFYINENKISNRLFINGLHFCIYSYGKTRFVKNQQHH